VDSADLAKWKGDFGATSDSSADGDNDSDGADFLIWQQNRGLTNATPPASTVAEPPGAAASLGLAVVAALGRYRRR
jgi:MYXO-CTERM domain-containing protein